MNEFLKILSMKTTKTGQIENTNIYAIKNMINSVYFIKHKSGCIMVDAGLNTKKIPTSLKEVGIDIIDVKWIFLTHSHPDHVNALPFFPNAEIYMCKEEIALINGTDKRNKMSVGIDIDKIILLSDGQELSFGETKVRCINAPGHTIGSMMYLVDNKYLFSGDAFMIKNGNISVHPFTMNPDQSMKTIEKKKETINSSSIILTSHYGFKVN